MVYSPPRPGSLKRRLELSSPASPDANDDAQQQQTRNTVRQSHNSIRTPPPQQQQQLFDDSPSFVHSSHSRNESQGNTFRQQQQQQNQSQNQPSSTSSTKTTNRTPAAWVNASLNPQRTKSPSVSNSTATASSYRRLGPSGSSTSLVVKNNNINTNKVTSSSSSAAATLSSHQVSLVPSAAEMVAIKRIVAQEMANPANPSSHIPAFGHGGHKSDPYSKSNTGRSAVSSPLALVKSGRLRPSQQQQQQQPQNNQNNVQQNHLNVSRSVQYEDDDNQEDESDEEDDDEEEEDEEYRREYEQKLQEAKEKEARFAEVNRRQAVRKDAHKKISMPISPSRIDSNGNTSQKQQKQQQQQLEIIRKKRPTYVVLGQGGKVEDVVPINDNVRTVHQDRKHWDPRYQEYEMEEQDDDDNNDQEQQRKNNKKNGKNNKTTYVVTRGYSYDIQAQIEEEERIALEEARQEHLRRMKNRGPLFSPNLPGYPKQEELELKIDKKNKNNEAEQVMEKQFKELQKQLMESNKQMIDISEERLRVLSRTLADAEDTIREERKQNELLRVELATSQTAFETLQTTLSSERSHWASDRDSTRRDHQEHIKSLEKDWTVKIEKANSEIARFLTAQEFEREQHSQQIHQLRKRQKDLEDEVRDLQTEVAIHVEGAKRAARIVEEERREADDRIVAAHARADGVEFIHQSEEGKLKALIKELQMKLEASMKREEQLEGDLYQMLRRVEDGKVSSDVYQRKYDDVTASLQAELERNRVLASQVDTLRFDLIQSEGEKEARKILERQNDDLERQLSELRKTVTQLMRIAQQ